MNSKMTVIEQLRFMVSRPLTAADGISQPKLAAGESPSPENSPESASQGIQPVTVYARYVS